MGAILKHSQIEAKAEIPAGFRVKPGNGLLVPEVHSRIREVITDDEWRLLTRGINAVCRPHNMRFMWVCNDQRCNKPEHRMGLMERHRTANGVYFRCGHRDLVYNPDV